MIRRLLLLAFILALAATPLTGEERYSHGAKFEPPEGRIIHGMGQWHDENVEYLAMLGDEEIHPLTRLFFFDIEPTRPWEMIFTYLKEYLDEEKAAKRIPFVNLELRGQKMGQAERRKLVSADYFAVDDEVAGSDTYDDRIKDLADLFRSFGAPVFLRIGAEFNGRWNGYHPYVFPLAFRKIVAAFYRKGAVNVAFIWCFEPSADDDFDEQDGKGRYRWYPGDDAVDWFGIDLFRRQNFVGEYPVFSRREGLPRMRVEKFFRMARKHEKPVMICESSVVDFDITSPDAWEKWFEPFLSFIDSHPEVKAFNFISARWPRYRKNDPFDWGEARIHLNPDVSRRWVAEMKKKKYIHAGSSDLLKDSGKYTRKKVKRKSRFKKSF